MREKMTYKVVQTVDYSLTPDQEAYRQLGAERIVRICASEEDFQRECLDADAIIVSGMTSLNSDIIRQLQRCRIIAVIGIGYQVDVDAATRKGICVVNVPEYCLEEVSDHTMALLLSCARKLSQLTMAVANGHWSSFQRAEIRNNIWPGIRRLRGATLGLIGFGNIAQRVVPKALGFGMNVMAYSPSLNSEMAQKYNVSSCDLDNLIKTSDYISLHCPLNKNTFHLINSSRLDQMKSGVVLINTARGGLIDEPALCEALKSGKVGSAGLDVLVSEPPDINNRLFRFPQVIVTAHSAHYSDTSACELRKSPDQSICELLSGCRPAHLVNLAVAEIYQQKWGKWCDCSR